MAKRDPRILKNQASVALDKGKHKKALKFYVELESVEPEDGQWPRRQADMYRRLNKKGLAIAALERAVDKYVTAGFLVKAIASCKMVLQLDSSREGAKERLATLNAQRGIPAGRGAAGQSDEPRDGGARPPGDWQDATPLPRPPGDWAGEGTRPPGEWQDATPVPQQPGQWPQEQSPVPRQPGQWGGPGEQSRPPQEIAPDPGGNHDAERAEALRGLPLRPPPGGGNARAPSQVQAASNRVSVAASQLATAKRVARGVADTIPDPENPLLEQAEEALLPLRSAPQAEHAVPRPEQSQPQRSASQPPTPQRSMSQPPTPQRSVSQPPTPQRSMSQPPMPQRSASQPPMPQRSVSQPPTPQRSMSQPPMPPQRSMSQPPMPPQRSMSQPPMPPQRSMSQPPMPPQRSMSRPPAAQAPFPTDRPPAGIPEETRREIAVAPTLPVGVESPHAQGKGPRQRKKRRTIPPDAPLDAVTLGSVVPGARAELDESGEDSGIFEIPIDDSDVIELEADSIDDPGAEAERALRQTPLLSSLGPDAMRRLIQDVQLVTLDRGQILFRQGEPGRTLYVVAEGGVSLYSEGPPRTHLSQLSEGDFFGEIAIVTDQVRHATAAADEERGALLLEIDRNVIGNLVEEEPQVLQALLRFLRDRLVQSLVHTSPMFAPFIGQERDDLAARFRFLEVSPEAVVLDQGSRAAGLFVLLSGKLEALHTADGETRRLGTLGPGGVCGEMSLLSNEPSVFTVRAISKSFILQLPSQDFREIIMTHPQVLVYVSDLAEERQRRYEAIIAGTADYDGGRITLV